MRALITNDDGITSPGLAVLAAVAREAGYDVTVVAPARESSGAGASLISAERDGRLLVTETRAPGLPDDVPSFAVKATPAYITFVAAHDHFGPRPDLVLSGINRGANTGNAIVHSGTVGAVLSAMTHGIRGIAVSLDSPEPAHWETAAAVTARAVNWVGTLPPVAEDWVPGVLNLNVPDVALDALPGLRHATLASFGQVQGTMYLLDEGKVKLQYEAVEGVEAAGTDTALLRAGWATATLLRAPCFDPDLAMPEF